MKKLSALFIFLLVCSCSCHEKDPHQNKHPHGKFGYKLFKQQDSNKDGIIKLEEVATHHRQMFNKADQNHDSKITRSEAKTANFEEEFNNLTKKSGKTFVTFKETFKTEEQRFKAGDYNSDGKITKEEFKKHYLESFEEK